MFELPGRWQDRDRLLHQAQELADNLNAQGVTDQEDAKRFCNEWLRGQIREALEKLDWLTEGKSEQ
jgi:polyhydroxyalkanoate synthesis regulator phasin